MIEYIITLYTLLSLFFYQNTSKTIDILYAKENLTKLKKKMISGQVLVGR